MRLINVDVTLEWWSFVALFTLQHENFDLSIKTTKSCKCRSSLCLMQTRSSYPGYSSKLPTKFLIWNYYAVSFRLVKDKKCPDKIFENPLFKEMFSCVRIKNFFIEYKYFELNANIFYWIQMHFRKYHFFHCI